MKTAASVLVLVMAAAGCGDREVSSTATTTQATASTETTASVATITETTAAPTATTATQAIAPAVPTPAKAPAAYKVPQIRPITAKQIRALVDDNKGKVVVVNFWATWCPPCVREFPALIKAYDRYHGKGVNMYAVSMNAPEEKAEIEEFLQTHKPAFAVYLKDTQDETFNEAVLKGWFGEMPMTLVFDTTGKQVLAHSAEITFDKLSSTVEPILPK